MIQYYINNKQFREHGIYVEGSAGYFDILGRKSITTYSWPESNGHFADLRNPSKNHREITLYCWAVADSWSELMLNIRSVFSEFDKEGRQRLRVEIPFGNPRNVRVNNSVRTRLSAIQNNQIARTRNEAPIKPLLYEVYMPDQISVKKEIKEGRNFGFFKVNLIEPNPVKKIYKTTNLSISLIGETNGFIEVFWGDGELKKYRGAFEETKIYTEDRNSSTREGAMKYIVIAGSESDLNNVHIRNAELVWKIL